MGPLAYNEPVLASIAKFFHLKSPVEHCSVHLEVKPNKAAQEITNDCPDSSFTKYLPIETRTPSPPTQHPPKKKDIKS